jgi:serine/threonine protein kinase, bacterial
MNNTTKNQVCNVKSGTIITGKWHKKSYKILKPLGYGANGVVYLAETNEGFIALKISENSMSITSEVNVLKHFSKVQGSALGPSLLDVDDWYRNDLRQTVPFYVMEYIKGDTFLTFIEKRGKEWTGILCLQLLTDLEVLHQKGWVFGDLKPDNLIVTGHPPRMRCIDVGGTTIQGRSIKEFTEFYDRGYWGVGTRKAEPSYDLFAVAMIIINSAYPKRFSRTSNKDGKDQLKQLILSNQQLKKFEKVLFGAIDGKYHHAIEMRKDLVQSISRTDIHSQGNHTKKVKKQPVNSQTRTSLRKQQPPSKKKGLVETFLIITMVFLGYILYIYGQLL